MTSTNAEWLLNYMIAAPFLVVCFALFMYWFTGWLDLARRAAASRRRVTND